MSTPSVRPATTYPAIVGRVLRDLRDVKKMEQGQLAAAVGLSQSAWSRIERGEIALTVEQLAKASEALGWKPGKILDLADQTSEQARKQGIVVEKERKPDDNAGLVLIGAAALGLIVAALLKK